MMMINLLSEKPHAEPLPVTGPAGTILNGQYQPPPRDGDGKLWVRTTALVKADAEALYALWRDIERIPQWQEEVVQVISKTHKVSHWVMRSGDKDVEWDAEILADEPGRRIAWRSVDGDVDQAGEVIFYPAPGGRGTMVTVLQEFRMGKLASAWETLVGRNPKQRVIENLRHFKAFAETGEIPRSQGQPHGPRGAGGSAKESAYGERIPTPPGGMRKAG
jgi:uncharacterized membrane protein